MAVLNVVSVDEPTSNKNGEIVAKSVSIASQVCLLSSSQEESGEFGIFFYMIGLILLVQKDSKRL